MHIHTDSCCSRVMNPDMGSGSSPGPGITMALVVIKTPTSARSSPLSLLQIGFYPQDILPPPLSPSLSPIPHHTFAHHDSAQLPSAMARPVFSPRVPRVACVWISLYCSVHDGAEQGHVFSSMPGYTPILIYTFLTLLLIPLLIFFLYLIAIEP